MRQVQALEEMDTATTGHDYTYKTYPARWRMLGIVFGFNFVVQIMFTTLMPVATPAADFYGVGLTAINWVSLVWGALFIPGTIFAGWSLFKLGLRLSIILAGAGLLLGSILRTVSAAFPTEQTIRLEDLDGVPNVQKKSLGAYTILLLGTMIMACVQPIILSSTTITAAAWFSEKQRNLAITLMAIANPLGLAVGSLLPVIVISNKQGIHRIDAYLGSQVALALVALVAAFFMQSRPPTAPSATANYKPRNANLGRDLKALFRNFGFLALCNIFSLSVGAFTALLTLMEQILTPRGYSVSDAGRMSAVIILSGIVGCAIVGPILDRYRAYKLILAGALTATAPFYIGFTIVVHENKGQRALLLALAAFVGLLGFPVLPTALDLSAETTYPISAGVTTAILWCCSQVTALVLVLLIDGPLAEVKDNSNISSLEAGSWLLVGCVVAAMFMAWLWSGRYVRHEAEGTVQRLRQAQRRDAGLPFVDIIADSVGAPEQTAPHQLGRLSNGNAAAAAQLAGRPGADAEQVSLDQA